MESLFTYTTEEQLLYNFCFKIVDNNQIKITIQEINKNDTITNEPYISLYYLDYLNERLGKIINFDSIEKFRECLLNNLNKKTLLIKPPYKNALSTIWKIFPKDSQRKNTFTLISSNNYDKGLSMIFFGENDQSKNIIKEIEKIIQNNSPFQKIEKNYLEYIYDDKLVKNMIMLPIEKKKDTEIITDLSEIIKLKNNDSGNIFIIFEDEYLEDLIKKIISKLYNKPIFFVIFTSGDTKITRQKINKQLKKLNDLKKAYIDIDNFYMYENKSENYKKIILPLLKVYSYYNQLGDGFFKDIIEMDLNIEGLKEEFHHLFRTHYFNILLCGRTGTGKSTFINKIMGEKKSFTLKSKSAGTFRNNYYCHKKYPIKIIDVCGFAEGNEGKDNLEKIKSIYNKNLDNIIIDQSLNDIFDFYQDQRNNIHLLLYFNIYDDKYDVLPGEMPVIEEASKKNIPIFFIVNKCPNEIFDEDSEEINDLRDIIKDARKGTKYENSDTYFINCLNYKGFDNLLEGIGKYFSHSIVKDKDMEELKNATIEEEHFKDIFKKSFFLGDIEPQYYLLNESLIKSIRDIQKLVIKLASYYSKKLGFFQKMGFYLFNKLYNNIHRNSETNFFPLLTDLVKKIYQNYKINKNNDQINEFIKLKISQYFHIDMKIDKSQFSHYELEEIKDDDNDVTREGDGEAPSPPSYKKVLKEHKVKIPDSFNIDKFKQDYINLGKLFWNSRPNFHPKNEKEKKTIEETENLGEFIFSNINDISPERLYKLIERDFGKDDSKRDATKSEKIILKLFYISYTSNELISSIICKINKEGFSYKSICDFYYKISKSYNDAIYGFNGIKEDINNIINEDLEGIIKSKD